MNIRFGDVERIYTQWGESSIDARIRLTGNDVKTYSAVGGEPVVTGAKNLHFRYLQDRDILIYNKDKHSLNSFSSPQSTEEYEQLLHILRKMPVVDLESVRVKEILQKKVLEGLKRFIDDRLRYIHRSLEAKRKSVIELETEEKNLNLAFNRVLDTLLKDSLKREMDSIEYII